MEAFDFCDDDEDGCLSWSEIETCEQRFCKLLTVPCPTEDNFHEFDLDGDGVMCPDEYDKKFKSNIVEDIVML